MELLTQPWFLCNATLPLVALAVAVWLFSQALPLREHAAARIGVVVAGIVAINCIWAATTFSFFPRLTDLASFGQSILVLLLTLALCCAGQMLIWECPPLTSLFICSMAYSLQDLACSVERTTVIDLLVRFGVEVDYAPIRFALIIAAVYLVVWQLLAKNIRAEGLLKIDSAIKVLAGALTIVVNVCLGLVFKDLRVLDIPGHYAVILDVFYLALCIYVMYSVCEIVYNRRLQTAAALSEQLRQTQALQFRQTQQNIEAIDRKVHDIRRRIAIMGARGGAPGSSDYESILQEIDIYDSKVKTGNDALDVILTDRKLACDRWGITLACIADGGILDFVSPTDLFVIFTSSLDESVALTRQITHCDLRRIGLRVMRGPGVASINVECSVPAGTADPGVPADLEEVLSRYDGLATSRTQEGVRHLDVLLPLPR